MANNPETQRPTDSFTAQDGARLFTALDGFTKRIDSELQQIRGQIAVIQEKLLGVIETQGRIESSLGENRVHRLQAELREAEIERELAQANLRKAEERLHIKQDVTGKTIDTQERMKNVAGTIIEEKQKLLEQKNRERWDEIKFSALKSLISWGVVLLAGGTLAFIGFLVQLYLNRGSP